MLVKVYNENVYDFSQVFRDKAVFIPAKKFIEMEYDDALSFLGTYSPILKDKDGNHDPRGFKKLRIDETDAKKAKAEMFNIADERAKEVFVCHACGKEFQSKKNLMAHIKRSHSELMVDEEAREDLLDQED